MSTSVPSFPRRGQAPAVATGVFPAPAVDGGFPKKTDGSPDFSKMSGAQKVAFARQRIKNDMARHSDNGNGNARR